MFDHVCLMVNDMKWHLDLFQRVFGFRIDKYVGSAEDPQKVWFKENLQLNRTDDVIVKEGGMFSHLGLKVEDQTRVITELKDLGGKETADGFNWIMMPNGLYLEILK